MSVFPIAAMVGRMTNALDQLSADTETRAKLDARRNNLILTAWRDDGHTWRTISQVCGMTELACQNAARAANGGVKPERPEGVRRRRSLPTG